MKHFTPIPTPSAVFFPGGWSIHDVDAWLTERGLPKTDAYAGPFYAWSLKWGQEKGQRTEHTRIEFGLRHHQPARYYSATTNHLQLTTES